VNGYLWLKLVHVLSAIVAVGTNVTYFVWLARARKRASQHDLYVLEGIRVLDSRLANPGYVLLPLTGVGMVLVGDLSFSTFWIATAIVLYVLLGALAGILFAPALRRQTEALRVGGAASEDYAAAARRTMVLGAITMIPIAGILYLMVMKPTP
jgi:uncharacterized membrane protein